MSSDISSSGQSLLCTGLQSMRQGNPQLSKSSCQIPLTNRNGPHVNFRGDRLLRDSGKSWVSSLVRLNRPSGKTEQARSNRPGQTDGFEMLFGVRCGCASLGVASGMLRFYANAFVQAGRVASVAVSRLPKIMFQLFFGQRAAAFQTFTARGQASNPNVHAFDA